MSEIRRIIPSALTDLFFVRSRGGTIRKIGCRETISVKDLFRCLQEGRRSIQPQTPPRPKLSGLMAEVNTYDNEEGFGGVGGSASKRTKDLLEALYESSDKLRQVLISFSSAEQRDDAVASFVRALLEAGPEGRKLLQSLPKDIKEALLQYLGTGDAWNPAKDAVYLTLAKMTDPSYYDKAMDGTGLTIHGIEVRSTIDFNNEETMQFIRRYQGAI